MAIGTVFGFEHDSVFNGLTSIADCLLEIVAPDLKIYDQIISKNYNHSSDLQCESKVKTIKN